MAIAAAFDLEAKQMDVVNAFTNSELDETVYCDCLEGFGEDGFCLLLLQALYGLRRSPLLWLRELTATLLKLRLTRVDEDTYLFTNDWLVVFFYVDDIVLLFHRDNLLKFYTFQAELTGRYEIRDLRDLKWFLGIRIIRDREQQKLWLC